MSIVFAGNSNLLGFVWLFYVSHFAHTAIKEHTLAIIHTNLLTLPWMRFWPAASHLDLMLKVCIAQFFSNETAAQCI